MRPYCYQCMMPLQGVARCAFCGFDNAAPCAERDARHLPCGTVLSGRYLIGRAAGEGGFGITYAGRHTVLEKRVAVKEFYPSDIACRAADAVTVTAKRDSAALFRRDCERFLAEAQTAALFSGEEGIVSVTDCFRENGTAYLIMDFLDGCTLQEYVNRNGCFLPETLVTLLLPVMRSLAVMHAQGVLHCDITPDNMMYGVRGKLTLMDFGAACCYTGGAVAVPPFYKDGFAPLEQRRGNGMLGPYTDVYALCATLYACITGRVPVATAAASLPAAPSRLGVSILPHQERALLHGLAALPKDRTPDMETLMAELTAAPPRFSLFGRRPRKK